MHHRLRKRRCAVNAWRLASQGLGFDKVKRDTVSRMLANVSSVERNLHMGICIVWSALRSAASAIACSTR